MPTPPESSTEADAKTEVPVTPLTEPVDGIPPVLTTSKGLADAVRSLAAGSGPVAIDAERASGYRYGQRTYLVQLRRKGSGTFLVDPIALPDLSSMSEALRGVEWVLHAASQDLPGLAEQSMHPDAVFDTELAARLLGMPRVGLAAVVADVLGLGLAKEHSAVDWSTRPLPTDWLRYAALDVEVLVEVRDLLAQRLVDAGKDEWARQEFEAIRLAPTPEPRIDPWRRTSGLHAIRGTRNLAVVRSLWAARDDEARRRDIAPGRILPDAAMVAAAVALPRSASELGTLRQFSGKGTRRRIDLWFGAIEQALALPEADLPPVRGPGLPGPPPPRVWAERDPAAAARLAAAKEIVAAVSQERAVPVENLIQPDLLRRFCWSPPRTLELGSVADALRAASAREWQVELFSAPLTEALATLA